MMFFLYAINDPTTWWRVLKWTTQPIRWIQEIIRIIIIGRLQSRRLRAFSSHNDPLPIQTACPGQSCCLCLPKGVECIWETGFVAFLVFSSHVVEYTVRTPCMAHHQASWVHDPETSVGGFWHFLLAGQSELDYRLYFWTPKNSNDVIRASITLRYMLLIEGVTLH